MQKDFSFTYDGQDHEAFVIGKDVTHLPTFVWIHGGGVGTKERIYTSSDVLEEKNITMLSFDQSGAGKDKDNIKQSSLQRRTEETKYAIEHFASKEPLTVCGSSMGGEIALRMLEHFPIKSIILFCPAIYDEAAFLVKFGEGFTDLIREPNSWQRSSTLPLLEKFTGELLIVIGELDSVIPPGVIELLDTHSPQVSRKEIYRIPNCGHKYQEYLDEHPDEGERVAQKVLEFSI
jgi:pimeloyl-ACP methyl ester carboxylesterase